MDINISDYKPFGLQGVRAACYCHKVYDGDSITLLMDVFDKKFIVKARLSGIDTPELRDKNQNIKKLAYEAAAYLRERILGKIITVECGPLDKYGRVLVTVFLDDININEELINKRYAVRYDGGTKYDWSSCP